MKTKKIEITNGYNFGFQFGMGILGVLALCGIAFIIQDYYFMAVQ